MYEIYEVPNLELDGTEEYLDETETFLDAITLYDELSRNHSNLWLIKCSDEKGYEKVIRT